MPLAFGQLRSKPQIGRRKLSTAFLISTIPALAHPAYGEHLHDWIIVSTESKWHGSHWGCDTMGCPPILPPDARSVNAFADQIEKCWNAPNGLADAPGLTVTLSVELNADGTLAVIPSLTDPPSIISPDVEIVYEAARRAIIRCGVRGYEMISHPALWGAFLIQYDNHGVVRP